MKDGRKAIANAKQAELVKLLKELAADVSLFKNPKARSNIYQRLEEIYYIDDEEKFRHFYSDFFPLIVEISENPELGSTEALITNLKFLMDHYQIQNKNQNGDFKNVEDEIVKLYDHINLDVARLNHFTRTLSQTQSGLSELKASSLEAEEGIKRAMNAEKNYITILGIFASIVLAFTGGLAFSTSVLENINAVSPYRLAFVMEGLAFVFINVMYILVWFIQKIHGSGDLKYPGFMWCINAIILAAVIVTIGGWLFGVAETIGAKNQLRFMTLK